MELLTTHGDLALAALNAIVMIAVVIQLRMMRIRMNLVALTVLAFFALRVASRMVDAPQLPPAPNTAVSRVIDMLSFIVLLYLLTQSRRIIEGFMAQHDAAKLRELEYARALRHYTQVVRHRMFNPLTTMTGTLHTLREAPSISDDTRNELIDSALAAAAEIERVSLAPERRDGLERDLDAVPGVPNRRVDD